MLQLFEEMVDEAVDGIGRFRLRAVRFLRETASKVESVHIESVAAAMCRLNLRVQSRSRFGFRSICCGDSYARVNFLGPAVTGLFGAQYF